jgi:hypothetical protein
MIRRGFWLAVGAVGGIIGYRRVVALFSRGGNPHALGGSPPPNHPPAPRRRHWVRATIRFTRDVREGMDLYMARHPRQVGPTLDAVTSRRGTPLPGDTPGPGGPELSGVRASDDVDVDRADDVDDVKDER